MATTVLRRQLSIVQALTITALCALACLIVLLRQQLIRETAEHRRATQRLSSFVPALPSIRLASDPQTNDHQTDWQKRRRRLYRRPLDVSGEILLPDSAVIGDRLNVRAALLDSNGNAIASQNQQVTIQTGTSFRRSAFRFQLDPGEHNFKGLNVVLVELLGESGNVVADAYSVVQIEKDSMPRLPLPLSTGAG